MNIDSDNCQQFMFVRTIMFLFMICCTGLYGCGNKCDEQEIVKKDSFFDTYYQRILPYTGNEQLVFLRNGMDTVYFKGQGKQVSFDEVYKGGTDCEIRYDLLRHLLVFKSGANRLAVSYFYDSGSFQEYFQMMLNDEIITGPMLVTNITKQGLMDNYEVLGVSYPFVKPFAHGTDTIYRTFVSSVAPAKRIVRIKYKNDVYEILP